MTVGVHPKSLATGVLMLLGAAAGVAIYVWMETVPMSTSGRSGEQIFLLFFAPLLVGGCLYMAGRGLGRAWDGATRFTMTPTELVIRAPLWVRRLPWADVTDFTLPPAQFPDPPEVLRLEFGAGPAALLPLGRFRAVGADAELAAAVPGLTEHGEDSVRVPPPRTLGGLAHPLAVDRSDLPGFYFASLLLLVVGLGSLLMVRDYINYRRIVKAHLSTEAQVLEIIKESGKHESVYVRIRYTAANGQVVRLRRGVFLTFPDKFKVGDHVTVDYLAGEPWIGRIPDWDLDSRQWILGVMGVPVLIFLAMAWVKIVKRWVFPLGERLAWAGNAVGGSAYLSGAALETLWPILPERHCGSLVLKQRFVKGKSPGAAALARRLKAAGLEAHLIMDKLLIMGPDVAARLLRRLGGKQPFKGGYMVLDAATAAAAERLILAKAGGGAEARGGPAAQGTPDAPDQQTPALRFYALDDQVGPLDPDELAVVFAAWIDQRLQRLYGGAMPAEVPAVDFGRLFGIDVDSGAYQILVERRGSGPRVWLRAGEERRADRAECVAGEWSVMQDVRTPRAQTPAAPWGCDGAARRRGSDSPGEGDLMTSEPVAPQPPRPPPPPDARVATATLRDGLLRIELRTAVAAWLRVAWFCFIPVVIAAIVLAVEGADRIDKADVTPVFWVVACILGAAVFLLGMPILLSPLVIKGQVGSIDCAGGSLLVFDAPHRIVIPVERIRAIGVAAIKPRSIRVRTEQPPGGLFRVEPATALEVVVPEGRLRFFRRWEVGEVRWLAELLSGQLAGVLPAPAPPDQPVIGDTGRTDRRASAMLAGFLAVMAIPFLLWVGWTLRWGLASRSWPTVMGRVTYAHFEVKDGQRTEKIKYTYAVGSRVLEGDRISFSQPADSVVKALIQTHGAGVAVMVYHDPNNAARSVLIPGVEILDAVLGSSALAALVLALTLWWRRPSRREQALLDRYRIAGSGEAKAAKGSERESEDPFARLLR